MKAIIVRVNQNLKSETIDALNIFEGIFTKNHFILSNIPSFSEISDDLLATKNSIEYRLAGLQYESYETDHSIIYF